MNSDSLLQSYKRYLNAQNRKINSETELQFNEAVKQAISYLKENLKNDAVSPTRPISGTVEVRPQEQISKQQQENQSGALELLYKFLDLAVDIDARGNPSFLIDEAKDIKAAIIDPFLKPLGNESQFKNFLFPLDANGPFLLVSNKQAHMQKTLKMILEALAKKQLVLVLCKNDHESMHLVVFLKKNLSQGQQKGLQGIVPQMKSDEELEHLSKKAGQVGAITVSTIKLIRIKNFIISDEAKHHRLKVIGTYLPTERDFLQIIGRSTRFGELGEFQFILEKERTIKEMKKYTGSDEVYRKFFTVTESYLRTLQEKAEIKAHNYQIIKSLKNKYVHGLRQRFLNDFVSLFTQLSKEEKEKEILVPWKLFLEKENKHWGECFLKIQDVVDKKSIDISQINHCLEQYQNDLKSEWKKLKHNLKIKIDSKKLNLPAENRVVGLKLPFNSDPLQLTENEIKKFFYYKGKKLTVKTIIASEYSPAFIGRVVVYRNASDSFRAFGNNLLAAWKGEGPWFPNLKAAVQGDMSWSQFFLGAGNIPPEPLDKKEDNIMSESTYQSLMQLFVDPPESLLTNGNPKKNQLDETLGKEMPIESSNVKLTHANLEKESELKTPSSPSPNINAPSPINSKSGMKFFESKHPAGAQAQAQAPAPNQTNRKQAKSQPSKTSSFKVQKDPPPLRSKPDENKKDPTQTKT